MVTVSGKTPLVYPPSSIHCFQNLDHLTHWGISGSHDQTRSGCDLTLTFIHSTS